MSSLFLAFDHTHPRSAQLNPEFDRSFDGDIGLQFIYGKETDRRNRHFYASKCGPCADSRPVKAVRSSPLRPPTRHCRRLRSHSVLPSCPLTPHLWQIQCFREKHPKRRLVTLSKTNRPGKMPSRAKQQSDMRLRRGYARRGKVPSDVTPISVRG